MQPLERWESRAEIPLLLLAAAFLVAYAWPPDLGHSLMLVGGARP